MDAPEEIAYMQWLADHPSIVAALPPGFAHAKATLLRSIFIAGWDAGYPAGFAAGCDWARA